MKFVLRTPAANVKGSPITGTQASKRDHLPNRLNQRVARSRFERFTGNHRLSCQCRQNRPNPQLTTAPSVFPRLAASSNNRASNVCDATIPPSNTSDDKGTNVAAKNAFKKRPRYPSTAQSLSDFKLSGCPLQDKLGAQTHARRPGLQMPIWRGRTVQKK